jgi:hydrogenase nickel incorporation protein HypB
MFHIADVVLVNKIDLLPYLKFDIESFSKAVKGINQNADIFQTSCTTGQGIEDWVSWIMANMHLSTLEAPTR